MKTSAFLRKFISPVLWVNLLAMALTVVLLIVGLNYALKVYTHHGQSITIPDVRKHSYSASYDVLVDLGLDVVVNDTGYVKNLPPGTVLDMLPAPGTRVKSGRVIYLTINALDTPTLVLPDIIDNSSVRQAIARLQSLGFKIGEPQYVSGEKDWVYGVLVGGRNVAAGDRISIESTLTIQVGNGMRNAEDSVYMTDLPPDMHSDDPFDVVDDALSDPTESVEDDFEVIE